MMEYNQEEASAISYGLAWCLSREIVEPKDRETIERLCEIWSTTGHTYTEEEWEIVRKYGRLYLLTLFRALSDTGTSPWDHEAGASQ